MNLYERNTCSFIVKVWVEGDDEQTGQPFWRGHIIHVFSDKRQYFEDLAAIRYFITPYLTAMGITLEEAEERSEGVH